MLISGNLQPVYLNQKAREICQQFWNGSRHTDSLPLVISDIYHRLIRKRKLTSDNRMLVMDYQLAGEQTIRIRAYYLPLEVDYKFNVVSDRHPWLLIFLEDRREIMQEELWIEQKKYNLTDRETQVLNFLLQACTYQDIATSLQISLNTVKFHVKNIYFKKRNSVSQKEKMYFEFDK